MPEHCVMDIDESPQSQCLIVKFITVQKVKTALSMHPSYVFRTNTVWQELSPLRLIEQYS